MRDLIDGTVDWNKENLFGAICDWHVPGLLILDTIHIFFKLKLNYCKKVFFPSSIFLHELF